MSNKVDAIISALEANRDEYRRKGKEARLDGQFKAAADYEMYSSVMCEAIDIARRAAARKESVKA